MRMALRWLAGALLVAALCFPAARGRADQTHFVFDASTGTITGYTGPGGDVAVPEEIGGVRVTAIGEFAFNANDDIASVALPEGLKRLEQSAFYFCESLRSIELPEGLEVIAPYALFANRALERLTIPAGVSYIGENAMNGCTSLSLITFLGEAPLMPVSALEGGPEERRIIVPAEDQAAYEALLLVSCEPGGARAAVDRSIPEEDFLFDAASGALTGYLGDAAYVTVPAEIGGAPVRAVAEKAFFGDKRIIRMHLPEGLETIAPMAFYATALVDVHLPDSLRSIGDEAFGATQLAALALPSGVREIGRAAFAAGRFRQLEIPEGIAELPQGAFERNTHLTDLFLPASLQRVGAGAFARCDRLNYIVFGGRALPEMGEGAFSECPVEDVDIAWDAGKSDVEAAKAQLSAAGLAIDGASVWRANRADEPPFPDGAAFTFDEASGAVTSYQGDLGEMTMYWNFYGQDGQLVGVRALGEGLFEGSALRRFFVPHSDQLKIIGDRAFAGSQLEEIYLFDSVTDIGAAAFRGCKKLARIEIPASVERVGAGAFADCAALSEVIFIGGTPAIEADAFKGCPALDALTLPVKAQPAGDLGVAPQIVRIADDASDEQVLAMARAMELPWFLDLRRAGEPDAFAVMPDAPNAEADFEFDAATGTVTKYVGEAAEVVVPRAIQGTPVERIGVLAFSDASVASILADAAGNTGLTGVTLPETVRFIEDSAFLESRSLKRVTCYGPIDRLGIRVFENCAALERVAFANGILEIDGHAFNLCESLAEVSLGDKLEVIGEGAFHGAGLRDAFALTASNVGASAFRDCKRLSSVRVTAAVTSIEAGAFQGMDALERIYFDRPDAGILGYGNFQFSEDMTGFKLCLPERATDDEVAAFVSVLDQNLLPGSEMVVRLDFD